MSPLSDSPIVPSSEPQPPQPVTPVSEPEAPAPRKSKRPAIIAAVVVVVLIAAGAGAWMLTHKAKPAAVAPAKVYRIGLSLDTLKELRWPKDEQYLKAKAADMGVQLTVLVADGDDTTQVSQMQNLISQKVDAIIVVPHSSTAIAPTITQAHAAGIKVLSYDRLVLNSDADMYISFDNEQVGKNSAQYVINNLTTTKTPAKIAFVGGAPTDNNATQIHTGMMEVLAPLIASKKVQLVYDTPTVDWDPDTAYSNFKAYLAKGNLVDGVIAANDGTAFGAIEALQEKGLAGKIPVTGQDAELTAIQRIIAGTQTMTNYKPIKTEADQAMEIAVDMAKGVTPPTNATTNNGTKDVPSYLLQPIPVTKDNIADTVVKDGFLTQQEIDNK